MAGLSRKRADLAVHEAMNAKECITALDALIEAAIRRGSIDAKTLAEMKQLSGKAARQGDVTVLVAEFAENGVKKAVASLTGRKSQRAELVDLQLQQRASELGYSLAAALEA